MSNPIRILHAVVNMNRGGAETLIMNLYRQMDRTKLQFDFLTCKEGVFDNEIRSFGGRIYRIPYVSEAGHFGYLQALKKFFSQHHDYSIVHAHMDKMSGFVLHAARKSGIPTRIAHSHSSASEGGFVNRLYKWLAGTRIMSSASHYFACSKEAADWLFRQQAKQALILPNGVELEPFSYSESIRCLTRKELNLKEEQFVIGHVGRFVPVKNHAFMLELMKEVLQYRPDSKMLLVGDGPLRPEIEQWIRSNGLSDSISLLGVRNNVNELMQAFDVLIFPSFFEGLPVTLIEAQAAGLPCIVSDRVSNESDLQLGLMSFQPIETINAFTQAILNVDYPYGRKNMTNKLQKSNYNITNSAKVLEQFYMSNNEVNNEAVNDIYAHV